jgi:hypothetical protein
LVAPIHQTKDGYYWVEHCRSTEDSPLHRSMKELGIEKITSEVIATVDCIDKETLLIREKCL